jgi:CRISPR-associated endonuclease/helicase Cas3
MRIESKSEHYPAATVVSAAGLQFHPLRLATDLHRSVAVEHVNSVDACVQRIVRCAASGACVAWVRNAVDDVLEAAALLRAAGVEPIVFHARFATADRLTVEQEVLRRVGRDSTPDDRRGVVIVATQVVEQSLDLDVDLLVSDLAPADLIIQRVGRLWRHPWRNVRPIPGPTLLLHTALPPSDPPADWQGPGRTSNVYHDTAVLWRSARALLEAGCIDTPHNIRALVEAAYDETNTPPALQVKARRAIDRENTARVTADQNLLQFDEPYDWNAGLWAPDERTPTRLGDERITVRLAIIDTSGDLTPLCDDPDWRLSEISLRAARLRGGVPETAAIMTLRAGWPRWEQRMPVMVLGDAADSVRVGMNAAVTYSAREGLRWL